MHLQKQALYFSMLTLVNPPCCNAEEGRCGDQHHSKHRQRQCHEDQQDMPLVLLVRVLLLYIFTKMHRRIVGSTRCRRSPRGGVSEGQVYRHLRLGVVVDRQYEQLVEEQGADVVALPQRPQLQITMLYIELPAETLAGVNLLGTAVEAHVRHECRNICPTKRAGITNVLRNDLVGIDRSLHSTIEGHNSIPCERCHAQRLASASNISGKAASRQHRQWDLHRRLLPMVSIKNVDLLSAILPTVEVRTVPSHSLAPKIRWNWSHLSQSIFV
mmetsp:Transcript_43319/g.101955  ORF Transcript_43319/g.101955 Transcript_43319/m.101955 type:complete len:271 (-) Transcript_43319:742-1554(-)